jgi:ACT domain-containing protein
LANRPFGKSGFDWKYRIYVHGDDRRGAVADILKKLSDARISLGAMQAVCGDAGTYGG